MIRKFNPDREEDSRLSGESLGYVQSDDKAAAVWRYLKRYQDTAFVKKRLRNDYPSLITSVVKLKAQHITDCMRQAEAYFETAESSDLSIKPLILYYGMLNLVKALIMLGDNEITHDAAFLREGGFHSHGLSHGPKASDERTRNGPSLIDEFCYVTGKAATKSVFKTLHNCWNESNLPVATRFSLGDILAAHPSTWQSYHHHTGKAAKYFPLIGDGFRRIQEGQQHIIMLGGAFRLDPYNQPYAKAEKTIAYLRSCMPELTNYTNRPEGGTVYSFTKMGVPESLKDYQAAYCTSSGNKYTMGEIIPGNPLHPIEMEFIAMFTLASLARYAPQKWLKNVRYEGRGDMFVVEALIDAVPVSFPKMILEELDDRTYTFS